MTEMSLADTLLRTQSVTMHDGRAIATTAAHREVIKKARRVRMDRLANDVWHGIASMQKQPHLDSIRLRLPFEYMWLEWRVDPSVAEEMFGGWLDMTDVGVLVSTSTLDEVKQRGPLSEVPGTEHLLGMEAFFKRTTGFGEVGYLVGSELAVTDDGRLLQHKLFKNAGEDPSVTKNLWNGFLHPALMGIALMNCRNVTTETLPAPRRPKKAKPERIPRLEFHTIKLPTRRSAASDAATSESREERAHHLVRGHFKTYTAEAPLMGKAVGTYWWGWQARGSKKNGIVVSDYELASA